MICFHNLDLFMCHVLWCVLSFWQPQLLLVMRMSTVRLWCSSLLPATSSNWSLVKPVRQWVPVTFLANLLCSCAKLPLYPHVSIRPGIGSQWILKHLQTFLGRGFSSDLKPDLFPPWKRLSYEWNFGVRTCLWSPEFPTSNMVVNSYTPAGYACQDL